MSSSLPASSLETPSFDQQNRSELKKCDVKLHFRPSSSPSRHLSASASQPTLKKCDELSSPRLKKCAAGNRREPITTDSDTRPCRSTQPTPMFPLHEPLARFFAADPRRRVPISQVAELLGIAHRNVPRDARQRGRPPQAPTRSRGPKLPVISSTPGRARNFSKRWAPITHAAFRNTSIPRASPGRFRSSSYGDGAPSRR